jgi:protease I
MKMPSYYRVEQNTPQRGERVLILLAKQYNDIEFFYPYYRLLEEGYDVTVAGLEKGDCAGKNNFQFPITQTVEEIAVDDYENFDMVYVPGGYAPEHLRKNAKVLDIIKHFAAAQKPIVSICHGPLVLADAGILQGKKVTCWPEIKATITQAGGHYEDSAIVTDGSLLTSRWPADLPQFMHTVIKMLH